VRPPRPRNIPCLCISRTPCAGLYAKADRACAGCSACARLHPDVRAAAAIALALVVPASALGASASLHVKPHSVKAGKIVHVSGNVGNGCSHSGTVTVISNAFHGGQDFAGVNTIQIHLRPSGRFAATTRIPSARAAGSYHVGARCGGGSFGGTTIVVHH
jgi:hypothetical protein